MATEDRDKTDDKDSDSDGDGAEEILEESPCKRWSKRREQVKQRDVPGIDVAYLAMDNETGNEVVWNEVQFSERKNFRAQEEKINAVFDNLTQLVHTNLVKFHKYWTDAKSEKPRIIFITEYMSSGSMSLFLQRTRKSGSSLSVKAWKKWTTQILSALNYLHSSTPPIIHGNLTCNTVFIQQNGLIKIGCVAPEAINHHVKTCRENLRNMHYIAPEYENSCEVTPAADIYSFGICALEIAVVGGLSLQNGTTPEGPVTEEVIQKGLDSLEDLAQKEFISSCLVKDPSKRPSARQLLFHRVLFEVHSLKLLASHCIVDSKLYDDLSDAAFRIQDHEKVAATSRLRDIAYCQVPAFQVDLEKFLEDVRNGIYPLTAFAPLAHAPRLLPIKEKTITPKISACPSIDSQPPLSVTNSHPSIGTVNGGNGVVVVGESHGQTPQPFTNGPKVALNFRTTTSGISHESDQTPSPTGTSPNETQEPRTILQMRATLEGRDLTMLLKLEDMMNRHLTTEIGEEDTPTTLVRELVLSGFVCENDGERVERLLEQVLRPPLPLPSTVPVPNGPLSFGLSSVPVRPIPSPLSTPIDPAPSTQT